MWYSEDGRFGSGGKRNWLEGTPHNVKVSRRSCYMGAAAAEIKMICFGTWRYLVTVDSCSIDASLCA